MDLFEKEAGFYSNEMKARALERISIKEDDDESGHRYFCEAVCGDSGVKFLCCF